MRQRKARSETGRQRKNAHFIEVSHATPSSITTLYMPDVSSAW